MGKNLIQQARGKGSPTYRSPSFRFKSDGKLKSLKPELVSGKIIDLVHCPGHSAPLVKVQYADGEVCMMPSPDGVRVGDCVAAGPGAELKSGNILNLKEIPEGTPIYNIESQPGDGGKFCRTTGISARIVSKTEDGSAVVMLPSKKERRFDLKCRAIIGTIAGGGRTEKPFLKAGKMMHKMRARNKLYPRSAARAMNAVDHPYGNKRTARKAKQRPCNHNTPPGRKVGKVSPRRTGRKK